MILTCPACASRYFVDDARVGSKGRTVRCASCAHSWRAEASPNAKAEEAPLALTPAAMAPELAPETASGRAAPLPKRIRAEAIEKKKSREAVAAGVAWAGLGAGFVTLVLAAALFRVDVVRLWPQAASAYAFAKMPVNPTGLSLETVQGQPNLIGGHAALSVTGVERNVETQPRASMPLRVVLYDKAGKRLTSAVSAPPVQTIAPGETRPFAVNFIDPPAEGSSFVVEFAFDKATALPGPLKPTKAATGKLALRGPATPTLPTLQAQEAQPLPATSPYALPLQRACRRTEPSGYPMGEPKLLLSEAEVAAHVERLATEISPRVTDETIAVCLLTGGLWFAADLMRALYRRGRNLRFDALWIASYGDEHVTSGRVLLRAGLQRPVAGKQVLVIDDVMDSGLSILEAVRLLTDAGASDVLTAVFARKPWQGPRAAQCDFVGWEAPARFLAGYGMDAAGLYRGHPGVVALD